MIFPFVAIALVPLCILALACRTRWALLPVALVVLIGGVAIVQALGQPRPSRLEAVAGAEATLVAFHYVENEAIWLWLIWPGETVPVAYSLPWEQDTAEKLVRADREGDGGMMAVNPLGQPSDREFEAVPVQDDPPK